MTTYTYLRSAFVSTSDIDGGALELAITTSSIGKIPRLRFSSFIQDNTTPDPLYEFDFDGTLSAGAETTLDGIVAAHAGPLTRRFAPGIFRESVPPTVNDDVTIGVTVGAVWIDTAVKRRYACLDDTKGAADWHLELSDSLKNPAANESILLGKGDGDFERVKFALLFVGQTVGLEMSKVNVNTVQVSPGLTVNSTLVKKLSTISPLTCALDASGAGGLDTGTEDPSTIYYLYLIQDAAGTQVIDLLFSLDDVTPTLPGSYDVFRLIGHVLNDDSSNIVNFMQSGNASDRVIEYDDDIGSTPYTVLEAGVAGSFVDVDLSAVVPMNSKRAGFNFLLNGGMGGSAGIRPDGFANATLIINDKGTTPKVMGCPGQVIEYKVSGGGDITIQVSEIHYSI